MLRGINLSQGKRDSLIVAIVGSARIPENDPRWQSAFSLGQQIAEQGWTVMTGGYDGLMAATSRGAFSRKGNSIGLPMRNWEKLTPDSSITEIRWSTSYPERISHLLDSNFLIAMDGGMGTLAELTLTWSMAQTEKNSPQIIIFGKSIKALVDSFEKHLLINKIDLEIPTFIDDVDGLIEYMKAHQNDEKSVPNQFG